MADAVIEAPLDNLQSLHSACRVLADTAERMRREYGTSQGEENQCVESGQKVSYPK
jgi:hypothetical protein